MPALQLATTIRLGSTDWSEWRLSAVAHSGTVREYIEISMSLRDFQLWGTLYPEGPCWMTIRGTATLVSDVSRVKSDVTGLVLGRYDTSCLYDSMSGALSGSLVTDIR
jgi:hypothetical protein